MPRTEIKGREAIKLPRSGNLLEISETANTMSAVIKILIIYQDIQN